MKPKFNIKKYNPNTVMHCPDYESSVVFLQFLHDMGRTWCDGEKYIPWDDYHQYQHDTCFRFPAGTYGSLETYRVGEYTVLNFYDFDWGEDDSIEDSEELSCFLDLFTGDNK